MTLDNSTEANSGDVIARATSPAAAAATKIRDRLAHDNARAIATPPNTDPKRCAAGHTLP
jgi:hypothetical protein